MVQVAIILQKLCLKLCSLSNNYYIPLSQWDGIYMTGRLVIAPFQQHLHGTSCSVKNLTSNYENFSFVKLFPASSFPLFSLRQLNTREEWPLLAAGNHN